MLNALHSRESGYVFIHISSEVLLSGVQNPSELHYQCSDPYMVYYFAFRVGRSIDALEDVLRTILVVEYDFSNVKFLVLKRAIISVTSIMSPDLNHEYRQQGIMNFVMFLSEIKWFYRDFNNRLSLIDYQRNTSSPATC